MTDFDRCDPPPPFDLEPLLVWAATSTPWGELSVDQADGFAPADDRAELPGPELDDDRGYGFGV